jgi:predicted HicB family RNase H-like nuclease
MPKRSTRSAKQSAPLYKASQYTYTVAWSEEDEVYLGRVTEFPLLAAHGDSIDAALREILFVVDDVIHDMARSRDPLPEPLSKRTYSGKFVIRMPGSLHRKLAREAAQQGVSLNQWINLKLEGPVS